MSVISRFTAMMIKTYEIHKKFKLTCLEERQREKKSSIHFAPFVIPNLIGYLEAVANFIPLYHLQVLYWLIKPLVDESCDATGELPFNSG